MDFDPVLGPVWQASTEQRVSARVIDAVSIDTAAQDILRPRGSISLRRDGMLVYGLSNIHKRRTDNLLEDSKEAGRYLTKMFGAVSLKDGYVPDSQPQPGSYHAKTGGGDGEPLLSGDGDFNLSVMLGNMSERLLRGVDEQARSKDIRPPGDQTLDALYDQSIDVVARGGSNADVAEEGQPQEADNRNLLRDLLSDGFEDNFGRDDDNNNAADLTVGNMSRMEGDLTLNLYSSSPPPEEVHTPPGDLLGDVEVEIVGPGAAAAHVGQTEQAAQLKRRARPKRRAGIVDEDTQLHISRAQSARSTLSGSHTRKAHAQPAVVLQDPLAGELVSFLDPEKIAAAIKRRRILGPDLVEEEAELNLDAEDSDVEDHHQGGFSPAGFDGFGDYDMDREAIKENSTSSPSSIGFHPLFPIRPMVQQTRNDLSPEFLEASEAASSAARETIQTVLESHSGICSFSDIAQTAHTRAAVFLELLKMSSSGEARCLQDRPYGEIAVMAA